MSGPRWRHGIENFALGLFSRPLGLLGWKKTQALGSALGSIGYRLVRIRVGVTRRNIERAFGSSMSGAEIEKLALHAYRHLGKTFLEFARFGSMDREEVRGIVRFTRTDPLDRALEGGKGAILFTGHYGNFELLGAALSAYGYPLDVLVQKQSNRLIDARIRGYRERMGSKVIYRGAGVRELIRSLRKNRFIAMVADQDAGDNGVFVDFLGTPASTAGGPARLAWRTGAPILFGVLERQSDGTHLAHVGETMYADRERDEEEEVLRLTGKCADLLSAAVRRNPAQYFWPHRRWKTAPPEDGGNR